MAKIALLTEYTGFGGGEANIVLVAEELARQGHEVHLIGSGLVLKLVDPKLVSRFEFKFPRRSWIWGLPMLRLSSRLRKYLANFDIVHAYSLNTIPYLIWINRPIVYTIHGPWEKVRSLRAWFLNLIVHRVTFVSEDVRRCSDSFEGKSKVVYLGVKQPLAAPLINVNEDNVIRLLCVGRFQKIKGQLFLIKALAGIASSLADLEPIFVGGPSSTDHTDKAYLDSCIALATEVSNKNFRIDFVGHQNDLNNYYNKADVVIIPSFYESFSMVTVESLMMGKIVVAPSVGGPLEILKDLDSAELFAPGDEASLQSAILKAIAMDADSAFITSQDRGSRFTVRRQVTDYLNIYRELFKSEP